MTGRWLAAGRSSLASGPRRSCGWSLLRSGASYPSFGGSRSRARDAQFLSVETSLLGDSRVSSWADFIRSVVTDVPAKARAAGDEIFGLRWAAGPLGLSCMQRQAQLTVATRSIYSSDLHASITSKSVSCATSAPRRSSTGAVFRDINVALLADYSVSWLKLRPRAHRTSYQRQPSFRSAGDPSG